MRLSLSLLSFFVLFPFTLPAAEVVDRSITVHGGKGCSGCHSISSAKLNNPSTATALKLQMRRGLNETCTRCHPVDKGHGVGKKPGLNREKLPLTNGRITCATTCHDMHIKSDDSVQMHFHLRFPIDRLCTSCHDK